MSVDFCNATDEKYRANWAYELRRRAERACQAQAVGRVLLLGNSITAITINCAAQLAPTAFIPESAQLGLH